MPSKHTRAIARLSFFASPFLYSFERPFLPQKPKNNSHMCMRCAVAKRTERGIMKR
jgi:hypothetical protein